MCIDVRLRGGGGGGLKNVLFRLFHKRIQASFYRFTSGHSLPDLEYDVTHTD